MPVARLWVGNFPYRLAESELFEFFSRWIDPAAVKICRTPDGESKGYGFLDLANLDDVDTVLGLDGYQLQLPAPEGPAAAR